MLKESRSKGQTLPLTLACVFFVSLIGVAFFYILQLVGGSAEHHNATDSGVLSLNKDALTQSIPFSTQSDFQTMFKICSGAQSINLGTYDQMISTSMIIAMNASADGLTSGQQNAANVIKELEGSNSSVGGQLKTLLCNTSGANSWSSQSFNKTALVNTEKMLGKEAQLIWDPTLYKVAYLESSSSDIGASNSSIDILLKNMPYTYNNNGFNGQSLQAPGNMRTTDGSTTYLRGYQAITFPKISTPLYAVPTQPLRQPHLLSMQTFSSHGTQPGLNNGVSLPPNGFEAGANTKNFATETSLTAISGGEVGIVGGPMVAPARIAQGFLVIDNSLTANMNVTVPTSNTWEANEGTTGTLVYVPKLIFSTEGTVNGQPYNALSAWLQTPRSGNFSPTSGPPITDDEGNALLYDSSGNPISSKQAAADQVPYDTNPNNTVLATDENSDPNGGNPNSGAVQLATPTLPDNLSPFNRAYHPNANANNGPSSGTNLTAAEQAKLFALGLYGPQYRTGKGGAYNRNFGLTGMRIYPNGTLPNSGGPYTYAPANCSLPMGNPQPRMPYGNPSVMGQVTTNGTIEQLCEQTTGSPQSTPYVRIDNDSSHSGLVKSPQSITPFQEVQQFIKQRMLEIKPSATDDDFKQLFQTQLPLGSMYYVYLSNPADPKSKFVVTTTAPSWARSLTPDGNRHAFSVTYPLSSGSQNTGYMIDAPNDFGVPDYLFMTNSVVANATDAVSYQSSSGANGLLGYVKFIEFVQASGNLTIPNQK